MRNSVLGQRYRILDRLGEGGMANVYRALDEKLGRYVAVKILHDHLRRNPDIRARFQQEAQAVSTLDHPNIMRIYDYSGPDLEQLWLVAEIINGTTLATMQQSRPDRHLPEVIAACIIREIARALEHAHRSGIVHRDIKPENVMVTMDGRLKLMDFGIAKDTHKHQKTVTGMFMGSPSYMSPEQVRGRNVDGRSDIYSLGVLFYELLTGRLPYEGASSADVVEKITKGEFVFPRFRTHGLSMEIDRMVVRCMQKNAESRFQSVADLGTSIDAWLSTCKVFSSAMELESFTLRSTTQSPYPIAAKPDPEVDSTNDAGTPRPERIHSGKRTKVRTAKPRLLTPSRNNNSKDMLPRRQAPASPLRVQRPRIRVRSTFPRESSNQISVAIAIVVAIFMVVLWFTDFRILRSQRIGTQPAPTVQTVPQTKTVPTQSVSVPATASTPAPEVQVQASAAPLGTPAASRIPSGAKPTTPPKPLSKDSRKPNRERNSPKPDPSTLAVIPTNTPVAPAVSATPLPVLSGKARVAISSQPAAEIFINNRRVGTTVDTSSGSGWIGVTSGTVIITLRRNGYRDYVKKLSVARDDRITLGSITLDRATPKTAAPSDSRSQDTRALTITSNRWPATVTIIPSADNAGSIQKFKLEQASKSLKISEGRYTVRIESDGEVKERRIDTTISTGGITYSVEFSRPQGTPPPQMNGGREP